MGMFRSRLSHVFCCRHWSFHLYDDLISAADRCPAQVQQRQCRIMIAVSIIARRIRSVQGRRIRSVQARRIRSAGIHGTHFANFSSTRNTLVSASVSANILPGRSPVHSGSMKIACVRSAVLPSSHFANCIAASPGILRLPGSPPAHRITWLPGSPTPILTRASSGRRGGNFTRPHLRRSTILRRHHHSPIRSTLQTHLPCQITNARQRYQQEPPEEAPPPAFLLLIGRSRRLTVQRAGQPIPIGTICPQRISFGCPPEQIVHISIIVFHN
jgi:hypothetical protein